MRVLVVTISERVEGDYDYSMCCPAVSTLDFPLSTGAQIPARENFDE